MADERITERVDETGTVTERTIERGPATTTVVERGGGSGGLIAVVLLIGIAIAAFFLFGMNKSETRKDDAVAAAAKDVGDGAKAIGDAAKDAVDEAK